MPPPTSILIHYAHKQTMGHTARIASLCQGLIEQSPSPINLHILQGGIPQPEAIFPSKVNILDVPNPFDSRKSFFNHRGVQFFKKRSAFILKKARSIQPAVFITEFFPFGRIEYLPEIMPSLLYLRSQKTRIYASIGYPMILNVLQSPNKHIARLIIQIAQYYDKILIHTPQNMENSYFSNHIPSKILRDQCQRLLKSLVKKIVYTGYVLPYQPQPTPGREELLKKKTNITTVLVTRGGGAVAPRIILTAIRAQTLLGENYRFIIACGPATSPREIQLFKNILKKSPSSRTLLIRDIPDLTYFLNHSDIAVATCGYNTAVQIMQTGIPSILLPFMSPTSYTGDQYPRAKLMNDLLGAPILNFSDLTPSQLAEAIKKQTHRNKKPMPRHWFNGRKKAADFILKNLP